jgi:hypothetical protein
MRNSLGSPEQPMSARATPDDERALRAEAESTVAPLSDSQVEALVREVTDEEVAHYHEYGWVMMRELVKPTFAAEMLRVGRGLGSAVGVNLPPPRLAWRGVEPYRSFMFSARMASNAAKLVNRRRLKGVDVPMRYRMDFLIKKAAGQAGGDPTLGYHPEYGTCYHQDSSEHGSDRVGELQFWMALAEVTPAMGPMRFINRSHREGPLGSVFNQDEDDLAGLGGYKASGNILQQYPRIVEVLGMSAREETHYMPGDVTVHHGYCAHGSIHNTTDRDRWSYLFSYSPADTRYWNAAGSANSGSARLRASDEENPVIYVPKL